MFHVLGEVALLAERPVTDFAFEWPFAFMHPSMIEETPSLSELFVAAFVAALDHLPLASIRVLVSEPELVALQNDAVIFGLRDRTSFLAALRNWLSFNVS